MSALDYPNVEWRCIDPEPLDRKGTIAPLLDRITQAARIYFARTKQLPNVILLRNADYTNAPREVTTPLPGGKEARIEVMASPFPGPSHEILVGRKSTASP